jgi:hypothetical protein
MSAIEDFDRQQAFVAGFALAARDWGLSEPEYQSMCKRAADMTGPIPPPAAPPTPPPAPVVPITEGNADTAKVDAFVAEKKNQVTGQQPLAPAPQENKLAAALNKLAAAAPPAPPPLDTPPAPANVLPPGKSALDPAYADRVKAWEASQRPRQPQHKVPPTPTNRLSEAMRKLLPKAW